MLRYGWVEKGVTNLGGKVKQGQGKRGREV